MPAIANTTIISNFAAVGQLELLHTRFDKLYIPDQVYEEIQTGLLQGYSFYENIDQHIHPFAQTGWLHLTALNSSDEFQTFGKLLGTLHSGEASCLSIAYHRGWMFISDDKAARKASATLGISISGTLGILLSLVKENLLSLVDADDVLGRMVQVGYYSPVTSLSEIVNDD
jgi:predicted nucleic acid-binding protein